MPTSARRDGDDFLVQVSGNARELKAMGARWDAKNQAWRVPAIEMNARMLNDTSLGLPTLSVPLPAPLPVPDTRLFGYQREAAGRLAAMERGQILVAKPGLGKTAMSIAGADLVATNDRVVVVAPAPLLKTWKREIEKWSQVGGEVYVWDKAAVPYDDIDRARWIVISWERFVRNADLFAVAPNRRWPLVILDESVLAKSRRSKRYKAVSGARKYFDRVWLLSGSPRTRYADDMWTQLNLIWPRAFPSYWRFAERYCIIEDTPWARVVSADRSNRDVAGDNADFIIVINEDDAGLELPEYLFEPAVEVALKGHQAKAYADMSATFVAELASSGDMVVAANEGAKLTRLLQIASWWDGESAKHDALLELMPDYEPPFLIWTHWVEGANALTERIAATGMTVEHVSGAVPAKIKDRMIEDYKAGKTDALVMSLGVGKFGHTLTNTRTIAYVDKTFDADAYFQSLHRVRRIGLDHRPVVLPFRAVKTVDELAERNLEGKMGGISRLTRTELRDLLRGLGR